jgi:hypothetical protein
VAVLRASTEMRNQVLNHDHIRPLDEQRAWLIKRQNRLIKRVESVKAQPMPWRVVGNRIEIRVPMNPNRSELLTMLRALEG